MVPFQENHPENLIKWKRSRVLQQHPGVGDVNSGFTLPTTTTTTTTDAKVGSLPRTFWSHQKKRAHFVLVGRFKEGTGKRWEVFGFARFFVCLFVFGFWHLRCLSLFLVLCWPHYMQPREDVLF